MSKTEVLPNDASQSFGQSEESITPIALDSR
jgi:hypothetical protein